MMCPIVGTWFYGSDALRRHRKSERRGGLARELSDRNLLLKAKNLRDVANFDGCTDSEVESNGDTGGC